jgi:NADPH:quinone reductase-like Zn-dependent oxidoreductase
MQNVNIAGDGRMTVKTIQAVRVHDYGGPELFKVEQAPMPEPGEGQVLVKLHAAGVNPADWKYSHGYFKQYAPLKFPWVPGLEGSGIVEAVAPGVPGFQRGQPVLGLVQGSYTQYGLANAAELQSKPTSISFEQAATVPVGALTAWEAVVEVAEVQPGQKVLIHGGAGGVGLYAVQLAKWKGANVTATASGPNSDFVKALGADSVIDYTKTKFEEQLGGIDAVIDTVGGDLIERSLRVIKPGGIFVTVAGMVNPEMAEARDIRAASAGRSSADKLPKIVELLESRKLKPYVGKTFELSQSGQAISESMTGHGRGRIVLKIQ